MSFYLALSFLMVVCTFCTALSMFSFFVLLVRCFFLSESQRIFCPFVRILRPLTGFSVLWARVFVLWARFFVLLARSFVLFYIGSYSRGRLAPPEFRRGGLRPASPGAGSQDAAVLCVSRRGRLDLSEPRQEWLRDRGASCWSVQLR